MAVQSSIKTSVTFDSPSSIPRTASTPIIIGTLDTAINSSISLLMKHTSIVPQALMQLAGQFSGETARVTLESFETSYPFIFSAILKEDVTAYRRAHVDRSTSLSILEYFLNATAPLLSKEPQPDNDVRAFCQSIGCKESSLFWLYRMVRDYYRVARSVTDEIFKKYIRKSWKEARKKVSYSGQNMDATHVFPNLILGVQQGLDRCCVDRGNLTASVQNFQRVWATHRGFGAIYGVAYDMSVTATIDAAEATEKQNVNFAIPLESVSEESHSTTDSPTPTHSKRLTGMARIGGTSLALLVNGLLPALSEEDKHLLRCGPHSPWKKS